MVLGKRRRIVGVDVDLPMTFPWAKIGTTIADLVDSPRFQRQPHWTIGESSIFMPVTVQGAKLQAWELTMCSPAFFGAMDRRTWLIPTGIRTHPPFTGAYLPGHVSADLSLGKEIGENFSVSVHAQNVANTRRLLDNSLTFGGFHYNDPRQIYGEVRYRFHF